MRLEIINRSIVLGFLLLILGTISLSCSKEAKVNDHVVDILFSSERIGVTIDSGEMRVGAYVFMLSNNIEIYLPFSEQDVVTIGIDGYWYVNGERTSNQVECTYDKAQIKGAELEHRDSNGILYGVIEGYSAWTFLTDKYGEIVLKKSLMARDADEIKRGINHRGFNSQAPENTLPAFRLSALNGFKYVETDVRFSSDGIPVLLHDRSVNRTSNGSGNVDDMTFDELRKLDFGSWKDPFFTNVPIPSLEEFLGLCRGIGLHPYIELKTGTKTQIQTIVKMVEQYGLLENTTFISFSESLLKYALATESHSRVGYLCSRVTEEIISSCLSLSSENDSVFIDASDYSENAVELCVKNSIPLEMWTANSKATILALDDYVSGVTSDLFHAGRVIEEANDNL